MRAGNWSFQSKTGHQFSVCRKPNDTDKMCNNGAKLLVYRFEECLLFGHVCGVCVHLVGDQKSEFLINKFKWFTHHSSDFVFAVLFCSVNCSEYFNVYALEYEVKYVFVVFLILYICAHFDFISWKTKEKTKLQTLTDIMSHCRAGNGQPNPSRVN